MSSDLPADALRRPSPAQEAVWYEEQLRAGDSNTGFFSVTMSGEVHNGHIRSACEAVVGRHPALRTLVRVVLDRPLLDVRCPGEPLDYAEVDVPCAAGDEQATSRAYRAVEGKRRWDLTCEPPIWFRLLRHGSGRSSLLVVVHHLCFDGRSKFVFARDFVDGLNRLRRGEAPEDRAAAMLPADDAEGASDGAPLDVLVAEARADWAAVDVSSMRPLNLPVAPGERPPGVHATATFAIGSDDTTQLLRLAAGAGTSLFGGLLGCLVGQLRCYGSDDIVVCVPADTTTPATRDRIGLAVNVVPVRIGGCRGDSFASVLDSVREALARLKRFRRVPFQRLLSGQPWSAGARSLFSTLSITHLRLPAGVGEVPGLRTAWDFVAPNTAQTFDLMFHFRTEGERVLGRLDYSARFDADTAGALADHFPAVLARALAAPHISVRDLAALPRESVLRGPASTASPTPRAGPDRIALVSPHHQVTYAQLDAWCRDSAEPAIAAGLAAARWPAGRLSVSGEGMRVLPLAAAGSPMFALACLLAWAGGGTLCVQPGLPDPEREPATVRAAALRLGINVLVAPFPGVRALCEDGTLPLADVVTSLPQVRPSAAVAGGLPAARLHAVYAPWAGTVVAMETWAPAVLAVCRPPVLVTPAPGVCLEVRGPDGHVLPFGLVGEIVVTAEGPAMGTGDLGRLDRAGRLHHLGAMSDTVTWAGRRLDCAALERFLCAHSEVSDAAVIPDGGAGTAYVVARRGAELDLRALRGYLKRRPDSRELRPSRVVVVESLPRLDDGGVDRRALTRLVN